MGEDENNEGFLLMILNSIRKNWKPILFLAIFVSSLLYFLPARKNIPFFGDESQWIFSSKYLEAWKTLPETNFSWDENYWTLTQPPIARYIIGIARRTAGFEVADLNNPWNFDSPYSVNIYRHNRPSLSLLFSSRFPMAIFASFIGTILFIILFESVGFITASFFLFFYINSEYISTHLLRAMGESPLMFFVLITIIFSYLSVKKLKMLISQHQASDKSYYYLVFAAALSCGLAGASKINGLMLLPVIIFIPFLELLLYGNAISMKKKVKIIIITTIIVTITSLTVFVLVNPFLYKDPIGHMLLIYQNRVNEMTEQAISNPICYLGTPRVRFTFLIYQFMSVFEQFNYISDNFLSIPFVTFTFLLLFWGLFNLIRIFIKDYRSGKLLSFVFVLILSFLPLMVAAYMSPLNYQRYYLFCVIVYYLLVSSGLEYNIQVLWKLGKQLASKYSLEKSKTDIKSK